MARRDHLRTFAIARAVSRSRRGREQPGQGAKPPSPVLGGMMTVTGGRATAAAPLAMAVACSSAWRAAATIAAPEAPAAGSRAVGAVRPGMAPRTATGCGEAGAGGVTGAVGVAGRGLARPGRVGA